MEGKGGKAGGAVVDCSRSWSAPRDAGTALFPSCRFTGLAGEALPAAGVATAGCAAPSQRHCHSWMCPASSLVLPQLAVACIPRSATGSGNQRAFEGAEPPLKVIVSGRAVPCLNSSDKIGWLLISHLGIPACQHSLWVNSQWLES